MSVVRHHRRGVSRRGPAQPDSSTGARARPDDFARALVISVSASIVLASLYLSPLFPLPHATAELLIGALPVIGAVISYGRLAGRTRSPVSLMIACAYGAAVVLASVLNQGTHTSLPTLLSPVVSAVVMTMVGGSLTRREFLAIGRVLVLVAALQALLAIVEVQVRAPWAISSAATPELGYVVRSNLVIEGFLRASGTMGHPILLGVLCSIGLIFVLVRGTVRHPGLRMLLVALLVWGVALSGSRSSLAALGFAAVVYLAHPRSPLRRGVRSLVILAVVPLTWLYMSSTIENAREVSPFSLSNRLGSWERFLDALSRPGVEALFGQDRNFTLESVADNQFLTTTGRFGVVGLLFLVAAVAHALLSRSAVVCTLSASIVFMFLSFDVISFSFTSSLFWLLVGVSRVATGQQDPAVHHPARDAAARRRPAPRRLALERARPVPAYVAARVEVG